MVSLGHVSISIITIQISTYNNNCRTYTPQHSATPTAPLWEMDPSRLSLSSQVFCQLQMSLADELLADLEEAGDEGEDGLYPEGEEVDSDGEAIQGRADGGLEDIPEEMEVDYSKAESVASIAKLRNSKQVRYVI